MDLDLGFSFPAEPPPTCRGGRAALRRCGRRRRPLPGLGPGPGPAPSPNVNPTSPSPPPSVSPPPPPTFPAAARSTAPTSSRGTPAPRSGTSSSTRVISVTDSAYMTPTELGWWHSWLERRSHRCFESTPEMEKFLCERLLNQSQPIAERFRALFSLHADQATPPKQSPTPAAAMKQSPPPPDRDLYALLHLSPTASDEEIRRSYRQWAQIYHPDKYQNPQMKEVATENFQRIRDAYEILTDEVKRQIYDIYGMEGLTSGLELGPKLSKPEEIREELERLRRRKEEERASAHGRPSGSVLANLSLPQYLSGGGIVRGMAMSSEVQSQISKCTTVAVGGNMVVSGNAGTGSGTVLLRHQISPVASVELMATAGLRSLIGIQTSRQLSHHSTATSGIAVSLKDGSVNLSNTWTRQLSESTAGNVQLVLGAESNIAVGWQKKDEKASAAGELKFGTSSFGASAHYTHHFSPKSHGRVAGRVGSTALEFEIGGGRRISDFSTVRTLYTIGIQGISWKFELHRGGQKLVIPVLLFSEFTSLVAAGALLMPSSLYFLIKKFVVKPYYLRRERQKALEKMAESSVQVREAREAAEKAQQLLENVASRKRNKQLSKDGLVITRAVYGNPKAIKRSGDHVDANDELASRVFDVTVPLNFLVTDSGQLKLHEGIKKSGIMGFCDPCPGEPKQLLVEYTVGGEKFEVVVDDLAELVIP